MSIYLMDVTIVDHIILIDKFTLLRLKLEINIILLLNTCNLRDHK